MWKICWWESKDWLWTDSKSYPNFLFLNLSTRAIQVLSLKEQVNGVSIFKVHFPFLSLLPSLWKGKVCVHSMWRCPDGLVYSTEDHRGYNALIDSCFLITVNFVSSWTIYMDDSEVHLHTKLLFQLLFPCLSPHF